MKKEFVPYEQALELKKLGFNEECLSYYTYPEGKFSNVLSFNSYKNTALKTSSPTFSQAFRWFREKYNLIPDIQYYGNWNFEIFRIGEFAEPMDDVNVDYTFKGGTYEEAELECLKKLIEIVKNKYIMKKEFVPYCKTRFIKT
jgi:hypothetical protein